jgi:homoserine kinase
VYELAVAASTSNLGPGFDLAGLALALHLRVRARRAASGGPRVLARGDAAATWPGSESDLLLRALRRGAEAAAAVPEALDELELEVETEIPIARGLGSSGAAVAAGLLLGAALGPRPVPRARLLEYGIELEGHPDNVCAALYGGLTLCLPGSPPLLVQAPVHPSLACALAWPEQTLETARARAVLPAQVAFSDAIENARRLPILLDGLARADANAIRRGSEDRLHERYRLPLIAGAREALDAARAAGAWMANLSGSGSALFALGPRASAAGIAAALGAGLAAAGQRVETRVLELALGEPLVTRSA